MTLEVIQSVIEMWSHSSPSLGKALINGYAELTEQDNAPPWMLFLADEYGFVDLTLFNDSHAVH